MLFVLYDFLRLFVMVRYVQFYFKFTDSIDSSPKRSKCVKNIEDLLFYFTTFNADFSLGIKKRKQ